jgi:threonine dehydratase
LIRAGVDRIVEVDGDEAEDAIRIYFCDTYNVAEDAGVVGLAALLKDRAAGGRRVGTVLSGGNVDSSVFAGVLAGGAMT